MGRGVLRGAGGDENQKFNFIWPYLTYFTLYILKEKIYFTCQIDTHDPLNENVSNVLF